MFQRMGRADDAIADWQRTRTLLADKREPPPR
jgi:hypothetical protein